MKILVYDDLSDNSLDSNCLTYKIKFKFKLSKTTTLKIND